MAIETTCIGAYPKPSYLRVGNWSESGMQPDDEQESRAFSYVAECIDDLNCWIERHARPSEIK